MEEGVQPGQTDSRGFNDHFTSGCTILLRVPNQTIPGEAPGA